MPLGVLYTLSAYILWGLFPFYFKALDMIGAGEILAHRIVWSLGLVMLILVAARKLAWIKDALTDPKVLLIFTCSAFLVGANWGVYVYAIVTGKTLEASLGYFINPLMSVALGAVFLKERLTRPQMLAVALAFVGVLWITVKTGQTPWLGLALAVSFALYGLVRKVAPLGSLEGLSLETLKLTPLAGLYLLYLAKTGTLVFGHTTQQIDWLLAAAGPSPVSLYCCLPRESGASPTVRWGSSSTPAPPWCFSSEPVFFTNPLTAQCSSALSSSGQPSRSLPQTPSSA